MLQDADGQIADTWSVSAGLDYPAVGPEHAHLKDSGRAEYVGATDAEALAAFKALAENEGIICAFESAHALAHALKLAEDEPDSAILVGLSGRGDKDVAQAQAAARAARHEPLCRHVRPAWRRGRVRRVPDARRPRSRRPARSLLDAVVEGGADMIEVGIPFSDPSPTGR